MPLFVSDLETRLGSYVHPQLTFLEVLNEVLPQLASRGIWKDLTFEESITLSDADRFLTLPEDADSVLFGMADDRPTPIMPLWQGFITAGASNGRLGAWYGVEDAGFVPTKSILSDEYNYVLYAMPDFRWGDMDEVDDILTDQPFTGNERIKITFENWEGVVQTTTDTLATVTTPQLLSPRVIRNIRSVAFENITVPIILVAVPVQHYGSLSSGTLPTLEDVVEILPLDGFTSDYRDLFASGASSGNVKVYSILNDETKVLETTSITTIAEERLYDDSYTGPVTPATTDHPVVLLPDDILEEARWNRDAGANAKLIARVERGTGITRYRAFRVQTHGNRIHLLFRRKIPRFEEDTDVVYVDNVSPLKYAILANTAEYNNDATAAKDWWDTAEEELNRELDKSLGAATPKIQFDPSGGMGAPHSQQ